MLIVRVPSIQLSSLCLLHLSILASPAVFAQAADEAELPNLTVTAVRGQERASDELPLSVSVITRQDLDNLPGRTIDEVLRLSLIHI